MGNRYSSIEHQAVKREIVLLKGFPCKWGKCSFCNYIEDNTLDEEEIMRVNSEALSHVTGEYGVLEVINSGSIFELPLSSMQLIKDTIAEKQIKVLYAEFYYGYRNRLDEIRQFFSGTEVRFRLGLETFDDEFRSKGYNKPFHLPEDSYADLAKDAYAVCLLVCAKGQTREMIARDIELGLKYFRSISINVFVNNTTSVKRDEELYIWFVEKYSHLQNNPNVELHLDNKNLGVYEQ